MFGLIFGIVLIVVGLYLGKRLRHNKPAVVSTLTAFGGVVLGAIIIVSGCYTAVPTGTTGIVTTFGRVEDYTLSAGFNWKAPWQTVIEMDNRVQKQTVELPCFSSDIQEVQMKYTINYNINKANAQKIYETVGVDYYATIVEPTVAESVKVATAKYTAEQLVQTRTELANDIEDLLREALSHYNIEVASTAIEDMDFTDAFTNAVESKQVAEQKKKQAVIEQEQALLKAENEKKIAETQANADAEVAKIRAQADKEVAQISADSAEYQGKKDAAIAMQHLASLNGWTVTTDEVTGVSHLVKADGTPVSNEELEKGADKLIEYYYIQQWDGVLPETYIGSDNVSSILNIGKSADTTTP